MNNTETTVARDAFLVSKYEWRSYVDEHQEKRVSDWERAEYCSICGRKIVHLFTVDGQVCGSECVRPAIKTAYGVNVGKMTPARDLVQETVGNYLDKREARQRKRDRYWAFKFRNR